MTPEELYKAIRAQIEHEDGLCNQRMIWLINLHALLFGAYAFSLSAEASIVSKLTDTSGDLSNIIKSTTITINAARYGIFLAGMCTPIPVLLALTAAKRSIDKLIERWVELPKEERDRFPQIIGNYRPRTSGVSWQNPGVMLGQTPIFLFPLILFLVWAYIATGNFFLNVIFMLIAITIVLLAIYGAKSLLASVFWPKIK